MNYTDLAGFHLPSISILIPMYNEEAVAPDVLEALLESDYPHDPAASRSSPSMTIPRTARAKFWMSTPVAIPVSNHFTGREESEARRQP